jgi:hypothetical protein
MVLEAEMGRYLQIREGFQSWDIRTEALHWLLYLFER